MSCWCLGGSTGAHSINQAVSGHLEALLELAQVVHVSGAADLEALAGATGRRCLQTQADALPSLRIPARGND